MDKRQKAVVGVRFFSPLASSRQELDSDKRQSSGGGQSSFLLFARPVLSRDATGARQRQATKSRGGQLIVSPLRSSGRQELDSDKRQSSVGQ